MAEIVRGTSSAPPRRRFAMRDLSRVASWGLAALAALTLAAYAASSDIGEDRLILAIASIRGVPPPERLAGTPPESQARQLAEAVRELSGDRDQLLARVDTLERNVSDVTSSIARPPPTATAPDPGPGPIISVPETAPVPNAAAPAPPDESAVSKTEFGIDLGRANSVEGLRQVWAAIKGKHGGALEGLRPVVAVREIARPGGIELRLVAGPLANAAAAARLCASLAGATCHPTVFDGQRLALR